MKKIFAAGLCVALLAAALPARAAGVEVGAPSGILMHASGEVLYEKDAHTPMAPASVTKIMTLLLTFEAIADGKITLDDKVAVSKNAISMGESQIWMKEGEQFTVHELIKCVAIASKNDCAVALAEYISGTEQAFAERMNERAKELGMENTHFVNCHGLDAEDHYTTAYDIALMSLELISYEEIKDYTLVWQDSIRDGAFELTNTNRLIRTYDGITGLKTGLTNKAGFCLSATASRGGLDLVAVVLGCDTSDNRASDITSLLNYGFANYASVSLTADTPLMPIKVRLGKQSEAALELYDDTPRVYEKSKLSQVEKEVVLVSELVAPVSAGQVAGELIVRAGNEVIASIPIVVKDDIARQSVWNIFVGLLRGATMRR